jgi:hypothetical protein
MNGIPKNRDTIFIIALLAGFNGIEKVFYCVILIVY